MSLFHTLINETKTNLIPENDDGYIEYKWRLDTKTESSIKKLVTQLLWRLNEGKEQLGIYEAHYVLGVFDNGNFGELSKDELDETKKVFLQVVNKANAEIIYVEEHTFENSNILYLIIHQKPYEKNFEEINIMICGDEQVGKSTLISYLLYSKPDNGYLRELIMIHEHEKINGTTSSVRKQILGIKNNKIFNYDFSHSWEEIAKLSDKMVNIYDTPGNKKYHRSILQALRTYMIDMIFIVMTEETKDSDYCNFLIKYCDKLNIPYVKIMTKTNKRDYQDIITLELTEYPTRNLNKLEEIIINAKKLNHVCLINNMFRVTANYNIPDRMKILGGIQVSGFLQNKSYKLLTPQTKGYKIDIHSICKKSIESKHLVSGETGSISYTISGLNKVTRDMIIVPNETELITMYLNEFNIDVNNYTIINGNSIIDINKSLVTPETKIILQDRILIIILSSFTSWNDVGVIYVELK